MGFELIVELAYSERHKDRGASRHRVLGSVQISRRRFLSRFTALYICAAKIGSARQGNQYGRRPIKSVYTFRYDAELPGVLVKPDLAIFWIEKVHPRYLAPVIDVFHGRNVQTIRARKGH